MLTSATSQLELDTVNLQPTRLCHPTHGLLSRTAKQIRDPVNRMQNTAPHMHKKAQCFLEILNLWCTLVT